MSPQTGSSRVEVEDRWRTRLAEARRKYDFAVTQFQRAAEDYRALVLPTSDGNLNFHQALAAESASRREYLRILRLYTDLVVHDRIPSGEPPPEPSRR